MAVVLAVVTIADHVWRSLFCVGRVERIFLSKYTELLSGYDKSGWPMGVTYSRKKKRGRKRGLLSEHCNNFEVWHRNVRKH